MNKVTQREPAFRIVSAHYDAERFYVPRNRSIRTLAGDDEWLTGLRPGASAAYQSLIRLSVRLAPPAYPKFPIEEFAAVFSAVRLLPSAADYVPYIVVLVDVSSRQARRSGEPNAIPAASD
jgi:hypothetical protein